MNTTCRFMPWLHRGASILIKFYLFRFTMTKMLKKLNFGVEKDFRLSFKIDQTEH